MDAQHVARSVSRSQRDCHRIPTFAARILQTVQNISLIFFEDKWKCGSCMSSLEKNNKGAWDRNLSSFSPTSTKECNEHYTGTHAV